MYAKNLQPYNVSAKLLRTRNIQSEEILSSKPVWEKEEPQREETPLKKAIAKL